MFGGITAAVVVAGVVAALALTGKGGTGTVAVPSGTSSVGAGSGSGSPTPASPTAQSPSPPASKGGGGVVGTWKGTWRSTSPPGASGAFKMRLTVSSGKLSGTISVTNTPCISKGTVNGAVQGGRIKFGAVKGSREAIAFTGAVSGDNMSGTYKDPQCGHTVGDWKASRTSA